MKFFKARAVLLAMAILLTATATAPASAQSRRCTLFPRSSFWYADVSELPAHDQSDKWIETMGASANVHPDFGSGRWEGAKIGIPITRVGRKQSRVSVAFRYDDESDPGRYPIPSNARIEGGKNSSGDRHVLVLQKKRCRLFELYDAQPGSNGNWTAGSGAKYNLRSNRMRPDGWTSADASGLPMTPGLVRYGEVARGEIRHVIRMTAPITRREHVWPARHDAGSTGRASAPPMGAWLRLSADIDPADFPSQARVVVKALQTHGAIIVDNGSAFFLSGVPNKNWDNDDLRSLRELSGDDFEFVQSELMQVWPNSMKVAAEYRG